MHTNSVLVWLYLLRRFLTDETSVKLLSDVKRKNILYKALFQGVSEGLILVFVIHSVIVFCGKSVIKNTITV